MVVNVCGGSDGRSLFLSFSQRLLGWAILWSCDRLGPSAQPQPQSLSFFSPEVVPRGQQHTTAKFWITISVQSREAACSLTMACRWLLSLKACSNLRLPLMRLHLGTLRCKHRTRIGQVTQGFDEECYSFRRCESRLDSASFKVGAGQNFCIFWIIFAYFC